MRTYSEQPNAASAGGGVSNEGTALEFFEAILPTVGLRCYSVKTPDGRFYNKHVGTIEELAEAVITQP
jgi:hypothetical protein